MPIWATTLANFGELTPTNFTTSDDREKAQAIIEKIKDVFRNEAHLQHDEIDDLPHRYSGYSKSCNSQGLRQYLDSDVELSEFLHNLFDKEPYGASFHSECEMIWDNYQQDNCPFLWV